MISLDGLSAFGVDHGEFSKGLPRAVREGGGGHIGGVMRLKNQAGKQAARLPEGYRKLSIQGGKAAKAWHESNMLNARVRQPNKTRRLRAELLNEDSAARRKGYKTGKTSGLDRGYRGRVSNKMENLP